MVCFVRWGRTDKYLRLRGSPKTCFSYYKNVSSRFIFELGIKPPQLIFVNIELRLLYQMSGNIDITYLEHTTEL